MEESNHSGRNLDTGKADSPVWLMKCPPVVARSWSSHNTADPHPLAKIVLSLDPLSTDKLSALEFKMEMPAGDGGAASLPKSYALNMSKDFVPMSVFSETNQGKVSMEGKVEHKFDMKPLLHGTTNLEGYGKLCRERTKTSNIKNRQVQVIDNVPGLMHRMKPMNNNIANSSKDKKTSQLLPVKQPEMKRTRGDRGQVVDRVFELFEKQSNWNSKQLVKETDQPLEFLKEILNELCVYNKRGTNQGTYQLKPEYMQHHE